MLTTIINTQDKCEAGDFLHGPKKHFQFYSSFCFRDLRSVSVLQLKRATTDWSNSQPFNKTPMPSKLFSVC